MKTIEKVKEIISEILDVDPDEIQSDSYLVRDLDAESIDLLELALELGSGFDVQVSDEDLFLRDIRILVENAGKNGHEPSEIVHEHLPHISLERAGEMVSDLNHGPVLKVRDLVSYMDYVTRSHHA